MVINRIFQCSLPFHKILVSWSMKNRKEKSTVVNIAVQVCRIIGKKIGCFKDKAAYNFI